MSYSQRPHAALTVWSTPEFQRVANTRGAASQAIQFHPLLAGKICPRRLRAGCPNEGWNAINAITPRLGRIVIVIRESGRVSAEWAA